MRHIIGTRFGSAADPGPGSTADLLELAHFFPAEGAQHKMRLNLSVSIGGDAAQDVMCQKTSTFPTIHSDKPQR